MPTDNNHHAREVTWHLADAHSDLHMLAKGLEKCGVIDKSKHLSAIATSLSSLKTEVADCIGHGRLPEDLSDLRDGEDESSDSRGSASPTGGEAVESASAVSRADEGLL